MRSLCRCYHRSILEFLEVKKKQFWSICTVSTMILIKILTSLKDRFFLYKKILDCREIMALYFWLWLLYLYIYHIFMIMALSLSLSLSLSVSLSFSLSLSLSLCLSLSLSVTLVSFRSAQKLSTYLIQVKLYPLQRKLGSVKCGKWRCEVCNNVTETSIFTSTVIGGTFKINHSLNCDDKRLIYDVTYKLVTNNTRVKLQISLVIHGITIKVMPESLTRKNAGKSHVCRKFSEWWSQRVSKWGVSYICW